MRRFCFDGYHDPKGSWQYWWKDYSTWASFRLAREGKVTQTPTSAPLKQRRSLIKNAPHTISGTP